MVFGGSLAATQPFERVFRKTFQFGMLLSILGVQAAPSLQEPSTSVPPRFVGFPERGHLDPNMNKKTYQNDKSCDQLSQRVGLLPRALLGLTCSQSMFTPAAIGRGKKPHMAEIKAKAHNCRVMVAWLAEICSECPRLYGGHGRKMASVTFTIAKFCFLLDYEKGWLLSEKLANDLHSLAFQFLVLYQDLARWAVVSKKRLYGSETKLPTASHQTTL